MILAMCAAFYAKAETSAENETPLQLSVLVGDALANNPDIKAAEQRWEASKARISQVQTLPDPKINVGYKEFNMRETMYGVSQGIPFPGKLRLRGEVAASQADILEQNYLATGLQVIAALKEAYYDLHFVYESESILDETKRLLQQFEETAEARYSVGQSAQQDIFRAQAEISRVLARLATLAQRKQSLGADINRLLNRPPADPLGKPEQIKVMPIKHRLEQLNALLDRTAPLLAARAKAVERGGKAVDLAKRDYFPNFELGAMGLDAEPSGMSGYQVMLNVEVPLYFQTKQSQAVREAQADREAAVDDRQAVRQELLFRIKDNMAQADRAAELVKILRDAIIPQARLTLASAQAGYAVGNVDFLTLLNSLLTLQENEIELHGEMVEHEKALARLEAIIGVQP